MAVNGGPGWLNAAEFDERGVSHVPTYVPFGEILCRNLDKKEKTRQKYKLIKIAWMLIVLMVLIHSKYEGFGFALMHITHILTRLCDSHEIIL